MLALDIGLLQSAQNVPYNIGESHTVSLHQRLDEKLKYGTMLITELT